MLHIVYAEPIPTPRLLSKRATYRYDDISGSMWFFVTHRYVTHMSLLRAARKQGIQVAFRYYYTPRGTDDET